MSRTACTTSKTQSSLAAPRGVGFSFQGIRAQPKRFGIYEEGFRNIPFTRFSICKERLMARDIDYAAVAVRKAIVEKFRNEPLEDLRAVAGDRTITLQHQGRVAEGIRDDLLAAVRQATSYANLWEVMQSGGKCVVS
jgi:hypothetical protein